MARNQITMIEYEDIFDQLNIMGYLKTIEMTPLVTNGRFATIEQKRLCSTCGNYEGKLNCSLMGKIKNPNCIVCSWWKEKFKKVIKTKRCSKCGELKPIDNFYKDKSSNDGHQYKCSKCAIEYAKEWQRNNKKTKEIIGV